MEIIESPVKKHGGFFAAGLACYHTKSEGMILVDVSFQKTGYGEKCFLICPVCGKRRVMLYAISGKAYCRECCREFLRVNIYKGIQHSRDNSEKRIWYTMQKIIQKYNINFDLADFSAIDYIINDNRPRYMRKKKYVEVIGRLAVLDWMRIETIGHNCGMGGRKFDAETIRMVETAPAGRLQGIPLFDQCMAAYEAAEETKNLSI